MKKLLVPDALFRSAEKLAGKTLHTLYAETEFTMKRVAWTTLTSEIDCSRIGMLRRSCARRASKTRRRANDPKGDYTIIFRIGSAPSTPTKR
jgi:hypothetical protein